jgi:putative addiction module component (TIGR02574 family)
MNPARQVEAILKLDVDERLRIVELIWDSVAARPEQVPLTDAQRAVIDERLADHAANPDDVIAWDDPRPQLRYR